MPADPRHHLAAADIEARFDELQTRLAPLWKSIREFTDDEQTIVVVPSLSVDMELTAAEQQAYEERFLFILFAPADERADGLRHLAADSAQYHRVLP